MTSDHDTHSDALCYTDYALQEYILGRLSDEVQGEIAHHLSDCEACRRMEEDIRLEEQYFKHLAQDAGLSSSDDCLEDLSLGLFLDDSISGDEKISVEAHLVDCSPCRRRLIALQEQIREAQRDVETLEIDKNPNPVSKPHLVLTMSKREVLAPTEELPRFPMRETGTDI